MSVVIKPGSVLSDKYEIIEKIGVGGMGTVYRAREVDFDVGRSVAIKVLPPQLAAEPKLVERFKQEIKIAAKLDHPHIVPIYFIGQEGDLLYFVMKHIKGDTLKRRIAASGRLEPSEVIRVMIQIGRAISYIHRSGAIHRDIKSVNIMFDEDGNAMLMDFGIAKMSGGASLTGDGEVLGTAAYMAPEQWEGNHEARSDLYSLGIVMYEALTGKPPFYSDRLTDIMAAHLRRQPVPLRTILPQVPGRLAQVVHRCLEKNPQDRFESCDEFVAVLEQAELETRQIERELSALMPEAGEQPDDTESGAWAYDDDKSFDETMPSAVMLEQEAAAKEQASSPEDEFSGVVLEKDEPPPEEKVEEKAVVEPVADLNHLEATVPSHVFSGKRRRSKKPLIAVAAVVLVLAVLVGASFLFGQQTSRGLTDMGHRFYSSKWYGWPPVLNATTAYKLALVYDSDNREAKRSLRFMAQNLWIEGNNYYARGDLDQALKYIDAATDIEYRALWVNTYNKIYRERKHWK